MREQEIWREGEKVIARTETYEYGIKELDDGTIRLLRVNFPDSWSVMHIEDAARLALAKALLPPGWTIQSDDDNKRKP
jgi:hypothetical protein